jgi:hypothetical protein
MGDQEQDAIPTTQIVFQPNHGVHIQMIGRFVQYQTVIEVGKKTKSQDERWCLIPNQENLSVKYALEAQTRPAT